MWNFTLGIFLQQNNWSHLRKANLDLEEEFLLLEGVISDVRHQLLCWVIIHLLEACHVLVWAGIYKTQQLLPIFNLSGLPLQLVIGEEFKH